MFEAILGFGLGFRFIAPHCFLWNYFRSTNFNVKTASRIATTIQ